MGRRPLVVLEPATRSAVDAVDVPDCVNLCPLSGAKRTLTKAGVDVCS